MYCPLSHPSRGVSDANSQPLASPVSGVLLSPFLHTHNTYNTHISTPVPRTTTPMHKQKKEKCANNAISPRSLPGGLSFPLQLGESDIKHIDGEVSICLGDDHGGLDANDVAIETAFAEEHTHLPRALPHTRTLLVGGRACIPILHHLHTNHEPLSADVANDLVLALKALETLKQMRAHNAAVLLRVFLLHDVQRCHADGACDGVPAKRIEVEALGKHLCDFGCRDDGGKRPAIADALCHGHNIRHHSVRLKAPEVRAEATKSSLHFIGNAHTAMRPHVIICALEVADGELDGAANTLDGLGKEGGDLS
eukprot:Opistho-2@70398